MPSPPTPWNILLMPVGSSGDVHPLVGLGVRLANRGHRVTVVSAEPFRELIERCKLQYVEVCSSERFQTIVDNPDVWHPRKAFSVLVRDAILPFMRLGFEAVAERFEPGRTLLIAPVLAFGARLAREKLGVPLITIHLQPAPLFSSHQSPRLPPALLADWVPRWFKQMQFTLAERLAIDRQLCPEVNALRRELDLPPVSHIVSRWWNSPDRLIGMFPEWYAPRQPDWPPQLVQTSFPLWDESEVTEPSAELEAFLAEGDPPIVFTPGSAMAFGASFFATAVEAVGRIGRRALLLTRYAEQIPPQLPPSVRHFDYIPFSQVLPRSAAIVHHGGIGTAAQGLRAGIPQLIMPLSHDQPDNAHRLRRLGVADAVRPPAFRAPRVARVLDHLTTSPDVARNCAAAARRFENVDGLNLSCDAVEALMAEKSPT